MNSNTRVYKAILPDGSISFVTKDRDSKGCVATISIESIASTVKSSLNGYLDEGYHVTIDFQPFHDMELSFDKVPKRCVALSPDEQDLFWAEYNKS